VTTYVFRDGRFVDKRTGEPMAPPPGVFSPRVMRDIPAYASPLGDGMVEGRAARREHLKRSGKREVDPSEFKPRYVNPDFARKRGFALTEGTGIDAPGKARRTMDTTHDIR
jgi:hypothetical protein